MRQKKEGTTTDGCKGGNGTLEDSKRDSSASARKGKKELRILEKKKSSSKGEGGCGR